MEILQKNDLIELNQNIDLIKNKFSLFENKLNDIEKIVNRNEKDNPENKDILNAKETAKLLDISLSYLYAMTCRKEIPYYKSQNRKKLYFKRNEIDNFILSRRFETDNELNKQAEKYVSNKRIKL